MKGKHMVLLHYQVLSIKENAEREEFLMALV
jgi:hypothetical protein